MQSSPRIEELRQKFHENPRRYFAPLANEYRKAGDPEQAIAICRAHLAQQPGHMSGHVVYGQALYDAHRIDEARDVFLQALALDPENIVVLRHLGDIARQRGDAAEARAWYSRALEGDPQDAEVAAYLAELTEPLVAGVAEPEAEVLPAPAEAALAPIETHQPEAAETASAAEPEPIPEVLPTAAEETPAKPEPVAATPQRSTPPGEAPPIVTRTMAELYLQQGHLAPALDIYHELAARYPDDEEIRSRIEELSIDEELGAAAIGKSETAAEVSEPEVAGLSRATGGEAGLMEEAAGAGESGEPQPLSAGEEEETTAEGKHFTEGELTGDVWDTADFWGDGYFTDAGETDELFGVSGEFASPRAAAETPEIQETPELEDEPIREELASAPAAEDESASPYLDESASPYLPVISEPPADEHITSAGPEAVIEQETQPDTQEKPQEETQEEPREETQEEPALAEEPSQPASEWTAESEPFMVGDFGDDADRPWGEPAARTTPPEAYAPESDEKEHVEESRDTAERVGETADVPAPAPPVRETTVREFFATLGVAKPPSRSFDTADEQESTVREGATTPPPQETRAETVYPYADDAFANLFVGTRPSDADSRAAAALSGAVAHGAAYDSPLSGLTAPSEPVSVPSEAPAEESEDDIRRFREWLDGLAES